MVIPGTMRWPDQSRVPKWLRYFGSWYDSRLRGLWFSPFFQHGSPPKPYNNIMLPCDSGADKSNYCNSNANFPPIQIMQLCLTSKWHCSVNYLVNNKSRTTQLNSTNHLIRERWLTRGKKLDSLYIYPRFFNKQSILTLKVLTALEWITDPSKLFHTSITLIEKKYFLTSNCVRGL